MRQAYWRNGLRRGGPNNSIPPGGQMRISLPSSELVFAQTCGRLRGSQILEPGGRLCSFSPARKMNWPART